MPSQLLRARNRAKVVALCVAVALLACACSSASGARRSGVVAAVGAENQYANVIGQIGGRYVEVTAVVSNPNTDPHSFEASPSVAAEISAAQLVVQNGVGYDTFMGTIEAASPDPKREVVDVQKTLGLPDSTPNPHLWYNPHTMPAVAKAITRDLSALDPAHAAYFRANLARFDRSLTPWLQAIAELQDRSSEHSRGHHRAGRRLHAGGRRNRRRDSLGVASGHHERGGPGTGGHHPQDSLFTGHKVKVFLYNEQVTDSITQSFLALARKSGIPVVGVYETMPTPGYDYQTWMLAEVRGTREGRRGQGLDGALVTDTFRPGV